MTFRGKTRTKGPFEKQGLYDPQFEHDACGVGLVANIKGERSRNIVDRGLEVLINLAHRGACGADPETGDGAGILIQAPHDFFSKECQGIGFSLPDHKDYGTGMVFMPVKSRERKICEQTIENIVRDEGQLFLGWRDVPVSPSAIGRQAARVQPTIKQFFVAKNAQIKTQPQFELKLYVIRKRIENLASELSINNTEDFYICSLSIDTVVYKGLIMAEQLKDFYGDLSSQLLRTSFAMVHTRFSTNTFGSWKLAHPYRQIMHNGEINTLRGNVNSMYARQSQFSSKALGDDIKKLLPIIRPGQSDTASLDNALEILLATGRSLPHAMMMLIPEAWGDHLQMDPAKRAFYEYHSCLMEAWDGPALVVATDGTKVCAILDRNGLRPCRFLVTTDNLLVMASETGVMDIPPENIVYKDRIRPGTMFMLDTDAGKIVSDAELKSQLSSAQPYSKWLDENLVKIESLPKGAESPASNFDTLAQRQSVFGYTLEDIRVIIEPMAKTGAEPTGSMGNDTPLAVLSNKNPLVFDYFKQLFAQVSNPPLDAIREELVTSVESTIGSQLNLFEETPEHCKQLRIREPILTNLELEKIRSNSDTSLKAKTYSTIFEKNKPPGAMAKAISSICKDVSRGVDDGYSVIILSDRDIDEDHVPIPSLLAISSVHHHLIKKGQRMKVGIISESGEPREVAHIACLIGYGAAAVNPYLVFETLEQIAVSPTPDTKIDYATAEKNYIKAVHKGILKVMSKMGISTITSYRGAQIFECVGLNQEIIDKHFTWTPSRIEGMGLDDLEKESRARHNSAYVFQGEPGRLDLPSGGKYQWRRDGELHMWNPDTVSKLQVATKSNDFATFLEFANDSDEESKKRSTLRGLLKFRNTNNPIPINKVEPVKNIVKRFATGAISLGSISREAHETLAVAMNRIGARSNTGEGGEDSERFNMDPVTGDSKNSAMKQVASGRFGVTINYLSNSKDIQIKMAQGSKPGEGGQLPGHKVDKYIGGIRNSTPGVELISPPPHHDIYSIEDLAQLIYDLKNSNPSARIHVKLVSEAGVGTIAAGVAKAHADVVLISGDSGGTGASPESSIKHAGLPWELGVAETQQVLVMNGLRGRIVVQTDGQLKTGRDVAIACLLGAEEFGFATAPLITMGCIMLKKCHLNTCSVGIATQDPTLRQKFEGKPEYVINYFFFIAEQVRTIMAKLGFRTINEMVGRVDKLDMDVANEHWKYKNLDSSNLLFRPNIQKRTPVYHCEDQDHGLSKALDLQLIEKSKIALDSGLPVKFSSTVRNSNRAVGTMLSHEIAKKYGEKGLPDNTIKIRLSGSVGQSFAAFLSKGITMNLEGDANDYLGKGLSGGIVVIKPPDKTTFVPETNVLVGNVVLYGAVSGKIFIRGVAGERFAVRNSGADAVVEGIGDHGCEYMTGGNVVILGPTGRNFGAGMSGGEAFVFDESGNFSDLCNTEMVGLEKISDEADKHKLKNMLKDHLTLSGSSNARRILEDWQASLPKFIKVMPHDYKRVLEGRHG